MRRALKRPLADPYCSHCVLPLDPNTNGTLSSQCPYLKALLRARPITVAAQTPCGRIGDRPRLARPSAPEGGAQGRRTIPRSVLGSSVSLPTGCGFRVPVSSEPYLRRHCGMMVSRRDVAIRFRASRAHGHFALVPPWTTPGVPRVRGTAPAWSGSNSWPRPGDARRPRLPSDGPSAAGGAHRGD